MKCPNCNETLVMSERQGVEIDYCPKCRGVWLDRGELDKIIDKSLTANNRQDFQDDDDDDDFHNDRKRYDQNANPNQQRRKKRGFLGEFFDFD